MSRMKHGASLAAAGRNPSAAEHQDTSSSTEGSSKSPVTSGTAPALPLWAQLHSKAQQGSSHRLAASPLPPLHPTLEHLQKSAAIHVSLAGPHQQQVGPAKGLVLSWSSSITPRSSCWPRGGQTAAAPWSWGRARVAAPSQASYSSPVPFQSLPVSPRQAERAVLPVPVLINFISIAKRSKEKLIAVCWSWLNLGLG